MLAPEELRLGRYTIVRQLGIGGMAVVYLCELQGIGGFKKQVVAKVIRPEYADNRDFVMMFLDEARLSATLNHPNVVQVFEVDVVDGAPCLVMEYVHGPSLARLVARAETNDALHYGHLATILAGIARGLHHAHFGDSPTATTGPVRMVHRDVSLQNVLVSTEGTPKLIDFGIAKAEGRMQETRLGLKGKLSYLSPEQLRGDPVDHRTDLYALGVCLYRASTRTYPYRGDSVAETMQNVLTGRFPRPSELVPKYPIELERIVLRALSHNPQDRFPNGIAFANALEQFALSGEWRSDRRGVVEWIEQLFPRPDEWLGPAANQTGTGLGTWSHSGALRRIARPPTPMAAYQRGLLAVGASAIGTLIVGLVALFVVLGFLVTQSARLARIADERSARPALEAPPPLPDTPVPSLPSPAPRHAAPQPPPPQPPAPPPIAPPRPLPAPQPPPVAPVAAPAPGGPGPVTEIAPWGPPPLDRTVGADLPSDATLQTPDQARLAMAAIGAHAIKAGVQPGVASAASGRLMELYTADLANGPVPIHPRALFDRILDGASAGTTGEAIAEAAH